MCTRIGGSIRIATILGIMLAGLAMSAEAQEIIQKGATTGRKAPSEEQHNKIDDENAEALPLPTAPDRIAEQAKKDLIDNLIKGNRASGSGPAGQEAGSEGEGMTGPAQSGLPHSVAPRRNDVKGPE